MQYLLIETAEFGEWFEAQTAKAKVQIEKRLSLIEYEGYFGLHKSIDSLLWELKWANGRRVYYSLFSNQHVLLLIGGNKNGQTQDINQAKKILRAYTEVET